MSIEEISAATLGQSNALGFYSESDLPTGIGDTQENNLEEQRSPGANWPPNNLIAMDIERKANEELVLKRLKEAIGCEDIDLFKKSFSEVLPVEKVADIYREAMERCSEPFLETLESFFHSKPGMYRNSFKYNDLGVFSSHETTFSESSYLESLLLSRNFSNTDRLNVLLKSQNLGNPFLSHHFCRSFLCLCFSPDYRILSNFYGAIEPSFCSLEETEGSAFYERSIEPFPNRLSLAQALIDHGVSPFETPAMKVAISSYDKVGCEFLIKQPEFDREAFRITLYKEIKIFNKLDPLFKRINEELCLDEDPDMSATLKSREKKRAFLESLSITPLDDEEMLDQLNKHLSTPLHLIDENEIVLYSFLPFIESPLYTKLDPKSRSSLLVNFLLIVLRENLESESDYDFFIKFFETCFLPSFLSLDFDLELFLNKIMANTFKNPCNMEKESSYRKTTRQILELHKQLESPLPFSNEYDKEIYEDDKEDSLETIGELFLRNKIINSLLQNEKFHSMLVETNQGKEFLEKLDVFNKDFLENLDLFLDEDKETIPDEEALVVTRLYIKYFEE